jgi:hypothetical protein
MIALGVGFFDPLIAATSVGGPREGHPFAYFAYTLAPFAEPIVATRLVVIFTFAQSVHYAIWLRLVPEDARTRRSPRPFRSTYRALLADLGPVVLVGATLAAFAIAVWAVVDLATARDGYLRAAIGHGHLELAAGALLFAGGRAPARGS